MPAHRGEIEEAERMVMRTATDEAVRAGQVAERPGDLKPQVVKVRQRHLGSGDQREGSRHDRTTPMPRSGEIALRFARNVNRYRFLYRSRSGLPINSANASRT